MAKLQKGVNDLKTWCLSNGDFGKQLLSEWTGECEDGKHYEIDEIAKASNKKFKWKCSKGHEWFNAVVSRTTGRHCPCCSNAARGNKVSQSKLYPGINDLKTWCLNNGEFGEQLLKEWTGECEEGRRYKIDEVAKTSRKKFKWRCSKGHEWYASVGSRVHCHTCCPHCCTSGTSYPEQVIYRSMLQIFPNTIHRGKYQGYEFDITIPEMKTAIEYGALVWHADKLDRDNEKKELCEKTRSTIYPDICA